MIRNTNPQKKKLNVEGVPRVAVTVPFATKFPATPTARSTNQAGRVMNSLTIQEGYRRYTLTSLTNTARNSDRVCLSRLVL